MQGGNSKENLRGSFRIHRCLFAVDKRRHLARERFLRMTLLVVALVEFHHGLYLRVGKEGEELKVILDAFVARIEPELVKGVWRGLLCVEPYRVAFAFAEFLAARFVGNDGDGERVRGLVLFAADELHARNDIAPLVGAANLYVALVFVE